MKKSPLVLSLACSLLLLYACGGSSTPPPVPPQQAATHLSVMGGTVATVGSAFIITVSALTATGSVASSYAGTVHFASSDTKATLPADSTLMSGTKTFSVTFMTAGSQTVTVSDPAETLTAGNSGSIAVSAGPAVTLSVQAPAVVTTGIAFSVTVSALDAFGNVANSYEGTVGLTSSGSHATFQPPSSTLTDGTGAFSTILQNTANNVTIAATDSRTPSITGHSNFIDVTALSTRNPVPFLNEPLDPDAIAPEAVSLTLTVNGTGFVSGSVVHWNGQARTTNFISNSRLTTALLASDFTNFNTAAMTVVNPAPGGGTSNVGFFQVTRPTSSVAFSTKSEFQVATYSRLQTTGDFNGDGKLDLVMVNNVDNTVSVLLGNGDGTFQSHLDFKVGTGPISIAAGDFNGDGMLDLAVANGNDNTISVLLGNGDGTCRPALDFPAGVQPESLTLGDFNGDGKLDLAVANIGGNNVSILLGNGDGTFQARNDFAAGTQPFSIAAGDWNADGKLDIAVTNMGSDSISVLLGNGDGTFQSAVNYSVGASPKSLAIGDFNGDGKPDLAMTNSGGGNLSLLLGNGDGTFQPTVNYGDGATNFDAPDSLVVGDFNGDGRLGLGVNQSLSSMVSIFLQPRLVSGPGADLSAVSLTFMTVPVGSTSSPQLVVLTNYGTQALNISSITASPNFGQTDDCGSNLGAGASCTISVTFAPSQPGTLAGTLSINDNAPNHPQNVALDAAGTTAELDPTSVQFVCNTHMPNGCTHNTRTATLTNIGSNTLLISSIAISALNNSFSQTNNCPTSLNHGQSCTIAVTYRHNVPSTGHLFVTDNGGGSPQTVFLRGDVF